MQYHDNTSFSFSLCQNTPVQERPHGWCWSSLGVIAVAGGADSACEIHIPWVASAWCSILLGEIHITLHWGLLPDAVFWLVRYIPQSDTGCRDTYPSLIRVAEIHTMPNSDQLSSRDFDVIVVLP